MKRLAISLSLFVGAAVPVLAPSTPARACSQAACGPQIVLPSNPGYIWFPGNAVNFTTGSGYPGPSLPRIFDATGAVVPASGKKPSAGRATVFSPDAPLPPGDYALEYDPRCLPWTNSPVSAPAPGPLPKAAVVQFRVGEPAAPPTTTGTLNVVERGTVGEGGLTFVRLGLVPSAEMSSYRNSATWTATVDGKPFREPGRLWSIFPDYMTLDCTPGRTELPLDSCGTVSEVVAGPHRIVMKAVVAGLDTQPAPIELTVDVPCGGGPVPDAGVTPTADASPTPTADADPVPPGPLEGPVAKPPAASNGGCAVAPRAPTSGGLLVALASLIALGARRKRNRRG